MTILGLMLVLSAATGVLCYPTENKEAIHENDRSNVEFIKILPPELKAFAEQCSSEMGFTKGDMTLETLKEINDPKVKCFMACIGKKTGKIVNGKVSLDAVWDHMAKKFSYDESMKPKVAKCVEMANKESDECELAGVMGKCMQDTFGRYRKSE